MGYKIDISDPAYEDLDEIIFTGYFMVQEITLN